MSRLRETVDETIYLSAVGHLFLVFVASQAVATAGDGHVIGVLPVAQAIIMMVLLMGLLRIEERSERLLGRLALGLAISLVLVGLLLQKFVLRRPASEAT